jgi:hypothetical protein
MVLVLVAVLFSAPPIGGLSASGEDVVFVGAGDIGTCDGTDDDRTGRLLDAIPGTVFTAGDNAYESGTPEEFARCYDPAWGRAKDRTRPVPGNHEYTRPGADGYYEYFGPAAGERGVGYYSYDLGEWHIIALNSNCAVVSCAAGSPQYVWLEHDLASHPARCTLAYFHHPRFSSGRRYGSTLATRPFWELLYKYGADVVISGHEHNYERFAPQTPDGVLDHARGIREFVVGTGGALPYGFAAPIANSEVRETGSFGVLKLVLHRNSYQWQFIAVPGDRFTDAGWDLCH